MPGKVGIGLLLAMLSSGALATWVQVGDSLDPVYVEPGTVRRVGDRVRMWSLLDYKIPQSPTPGVWYKSAKIQYEYDCKNEKVRQLYFSWHSGNMGRDGIVFKSATPKEVWDPIPAGSMAQTLWALVCVKKFPADGIATR